MVSQVLGGRYEVRRQLGKQAGRETVLGRDIKTQKLVVIKLLTFGSDFEWEEIKLCMREAQVLKALDHPSIPHYLNYFDLDSPTDKGFALVQTYIEGKSLKEQCQAGRTFSEAEAKQIGRAVLNSLIYLHRREPVVIHGNLKPGNVLLTNRSGNSVGEVYLVDFGSVQLSVASRAIAAADTCGYIPPEQAHGRTVPASDLYSLGATLIYLVTSKHPKDLPQKHSQIQFEQVANLSSAMNSWLRRMTHPNLDSRFTSAQEALQALEALPSRKKAKNATLPVVPKPADSKVLLTKDANSLAILMPAAGFQPSKILLYVFAIAWMGATAYWTVSSLFITFPLNVIFALCSLPIWLVGFSLVYRVLFPLLGRRRLHLSQEQITLTHELFGWKLPRSRCSRRADITKLVYTAKHTTTDMSDEPVEVPPQLVIWAGTQKYELSGTSDTSSVEQEMAWLGQELSQWLGLPIKRE